MIRALFVLLCAAVAASAADPSVVRIEKQGAGFRLLRNGQPYFIRGGADRYLDQLAGAGGNSIRSYSPRVRFDQLDANGITVLMGLNVAKPRNSFNYRDEAKVAAQLAAIEQTVRSLKDQPAILMWALGNEVELAASDEDRILIWKAMEQMTQAIHRIDPNHPVIAVLAGPGKTKLSELAEHCPSLDAVGINSYGGMSTLPETIAAQHWTKPYIVTEFGPRGHWEVPKTAWGMPIEDTSSEKAAFYLKAYQHAISNRPACLGSYVFLWGQKQEKTHTWYGLFLPDGRPLEPIDTMTFAWTGKWPVNRAPHIEGGIRLEGSPQTVPGTPLKLAITASDPDGDSITIDWDLRRDVADNPSKGGDPEPAVPALATARGREVELRLPAEPGNYRVFVYVSDPKGKTATANLPLRAEPRP